jgi:pimeloyl-ACP methyl ester carboxylesterase
VAVPRALLAGWLLLAGACTAATADAPWTIAVLDRQGVAVPSIVDGNAVRVRIVAPQPVRSSTDIVVRLDGQAAPVAGCTIARAATRCESDVVGTLGWRYAADAAARPTRTLVAVPKAGREVARVSLRVAPRPVVLVHGFMSNAATWAAYTGGDGFLAASGLQAFAVGDGRVDGAMNMGDLAHPGNASRSLADNAATLRGYIAGVRRATGADMVDVVAHSMGGLVSRYYIARLMQQRDVAQLVMLGAPHGGSDCSALPAKLGYFSPASLELRPAYLQKIFNRAVTTRRGVPFHMLAGNRILDTFKAPCSGVPSDVVVALDSAASIAGSLTEFPVLHTDMTKSGDVFRRFVLPRLRSPPGGFPLDADPLPPPDDAGTTQFTQVHAGHVDAGATVEVEVNLDDVALASFALFDPSRSLTLTVRGASGNAITLTAAEHGLIRIDDPQSMVYLGYGVDKPRPGPWKLTLSATPRTGTDFALSARVVGGAVLEPRASALTPSTNQVVTLGGTLRLPGRTLADVTMQAVVHGPNGKSRTLDLRSSADGMSVAWTPTEAGLHAVDIVAKARADGLRIERTAFLAVDVAP